MPDKTVTSVRPLSSELQEIARTVLNEEPGRLNENLEHIKEWLSKQRHLPSVIDDQLLVTFLRSCKFSLEKTKRKLDTYYTVKSALPEFYRDRDVLREDIVAIHSLGYTLPMLKPTQRCQRPFLMRLADKNPSHYNPTSTFIVSTLLIDLLMQEDDHFAVAGVVLLFDLEGCEFGHLIKMPPTLAKKTIVCLQDALPLRIEGIHFVNGEAIVQNLLKIFKVFLKEKLRRRIHVHGKDLTSLYQHIPRECLPSEYGGTAGPVDSLAAHWNKRLLNKREYFKNLESFKSDETKRAGPGVSGSELFGIEGSFKQLAVD